MPFASGFARFPPRRAKHFPDARVTWIFPKIMGAPGLRGGELHLPSGVRSQPRKRIPDGTAMLERIELVAVALGVMQPNVIRCNHSLDVRGPVVAAIEIDMVAMGSRLIDIDTVAHVPFVRQPVRRKQMAVYRLIDHLVTAK